MMNKKEVRKYLGKWWVRDEDFIVNWKIEHPNGDINQYNERGDLLYWSRNGQLIGHYRFSNNLGTKFPMGFNSGLYYHHIRKKNNLIWKRWS